MELKSEVNKMSPKMGRPTDCKKDHDLKARVDSDTYKKLLEYCEKNGVTKAEVIRKGILLVLNEQ